ncbi:Synergin gamma [Mizuhopecten yessoensis]|uniref:Synergin gamma n=1 Tax=Mizuhopecten yessoensis TaxID=6573 RepID=A0A210QIQ7_MIZYE|nr:Synergin gamma [Mizuhopecten yessoensis]
MVLFSNYILPGSTSNVKEFSMADNRNIRYPGQPPGNFGMMPNPGMPQFQQPGTGIQMMPMMHTGMMMPPGNRMMAPQQMMFPVQQMAMRPPDGPRIAPPAYTQKMADSFKHRAPSHQAPGQTNRPVTMSAEQLRQLEEKQRKEKQFLAQKQKLQAFGRPVPVDADKFSKGLMESMFGKVDRPKPKKELPSKKEGFAEQEDDGFGDFMAGPCTTVSAPIENMAAPETQSLPQSLPEPPSGENPAISQSKEEKKDLMSMMMECSDLKAPNKAKTFHRPALKELPTTTQTYHHTFHQSQQARQWTQPVEELSELFTLDPSTQPVPHPGQPPQGQEGAKFEIPGWCKEEDRIPPVYKQVLEAAIVNGQIATERLYPILLMSGLNKETLGQIWNLANRTTPGQLIKEELYLMLALIAFAQNNYQALTMDMLNKLPQPPIPFLGQQGQGPSGPPGSQGHGHPGQQGQGPPGPGPQSQQGQCLPIPPTAVSQQMVPSPIIQSGTPLQQGIQVPVIQPVVGVATAATMEVFVPSGDDDFADFQAAGPTPKTVKFLNICFRYLYEVPTPAEAERMTGPITSEMTYSNVQNFFGSDDSSGKCPSTPNSLEADFDDFKSADSKPSDSSQFSSEQSENEDFKAFESYLEDFERKKQKQQESPLHRPVSKSSLPLPSMPSTAVPTAIPAIRNLWSKPHGDAIVTSVPSKPLQSSQFHTPDLVVADSTEKSDQQFGNSPPKSSDSDFADFQQAPVVGNFSKSAVSRLTADHDQLKASGSDVSLTLIGEEDKYAALRSLDFGSELSTGNEAGSAEGPNPPEEGAEDDDENWADFQGVVLDQEPKTEPTGTEVPGTDSGKESILSLFNSAPPITSSVNSDQPMDATVTSVTPLPLDSNTDSDWTGFGESSKTSTEADSGWPAFSSSSTFGDSGHLEPAPAFEQTETASDDWADFQGPEDVSSATTDSSSGVDKDAVISVKKEGLQSEEILGLFKVREPQNLPTDLKEVYTQKTAVNSEWNPQVAASTNTYLDGESKVFSAKAKRLPSLGPEDEEEDSFRVPPPMDDDQGDEDFSEFSRGYEDMDNYHQPQTMLDDGRRKYHMSGVGVVSKPVVKEAKKAASNAQSRYADIMMLDQTDVDQGLPKDTLDIGQDQLSITKSEDSQSISSLELPFSKSRLQNVLDQDTQSISSNEYGNFETILPRQLNTPVNMESKSVDSLDLIKDEGNGDSSEDQGSGDRSRGESPEKGAELSTTEGTNVEETANVNDTFQASMQNTLPVLGDRYSNILQDIPGSDKHSYEWQRCLDNSYRMIKDANNIFNSISSSVVCNEVLKSEQGSEYVQGVVEIFRVVCRITTAMKSQGLATDKLSQLLKDIDLSWNNLTAFLVGGNLMPDDNSLHFNNALLKSDDSLSQRKACGVCLLNVDTLSKNFNREDECPKLTYGGRQYHASCANFWVNCVDSTLPALKLTELL